MSVQVVSKFWHHLYSDFSFSFLLFSFCLFRATPAARGSSQARGSNWSCSRQPIPQPQQCKIQAMSAAYITAHSSAGSFNPLSGGGDQICILMDTSWVLSPLSHKGNSLDFFFLMLFSVSIWQLKGSVFWFLVFCQAQGVCSSPVRGFNSMPQLQAEPWP